MKLLRIDEHLSPQDRETVARLREAAQSLEVSPPPLLDDVVAAGRRHARRRRFTGVGAVAAVAITAIGVSLGTGGADGAVPSTAGPAASAPEVTVTTLDESPTLLYSAAERAVAEAGVTVEGGFRWRSKGANLIGGIAIDAATRRVEGLPPDDVPSSGFYTQGYVPALGAELLISTSRLDEPLPADVDYCGYFAVVEEKASCTGSELPAGQLAELVYGGGERAAAVAVQGDSVVHVESKVAKRASGAEVDEPAHVPLETLVRLATDPRLRW